MDKFWKISQQNEYALEAKTSIAKMLTMVSESLPREQGNGWKLSTFHNIMHIVGDMCKYENNTKHLPLRWLDIYPTHLSLKNWCQL